MTPLALTVTPTDRVTDLDGVPVRVWRGRTADGVEVLFFVHRVAVPSDAPAAQAAFARRLLEQLPPAVPVPLALVLGAGPRPPN